ncbi:hypothetical protein BDP27DRAFT_805171 [Rhodocollybia butyracea]|uniref:RanBP2-type domain-containing protein n=1 Tax=Rhodocollybia butyracea TaxID=206335 RepID=A0A9P5QA63_9AGAR|nr:hypothetical protein BDP27DRAFT_805171 [Rhodocollybia butyracea]
MAKRKQKRNKVTNSSAGHETSSGCDTSIDITSSSEAEDWSGMDPDHDWEFKVVGVEIEAVRGDEVYETRWPTWSRIDGTTNTWERIKNNPNSVLETSQWDEARQKKVRRLRKQVKRDLGLSKTKRNLTSFPLSPSLSIPISSSLDLISTPTRNHAEFMNEKMDLAEKFRGSGMAHMAKKLQKKELEKRWDILVSELGYKEATKLIKEVEVDTDDDEMDLEEKDDGFEEKSEDGEERGERDEEMGDPDTDDDQQSYRRRSVDDTRSATLSQKQNSTASARRVALTRGARKSVRTRAASRSTSTRSGSSAAISYSSTSASASSFSSYAFSGTVASTSSSGAHASIDDDVELGGPSPTGSTDAGTEWSCFMCTFKNLPGAMKCIMCDRPNAQLNWVAQSAQSLPVTAAILSSSSITPKQRIAPTRSLSMASTMPTTLLSTSSVHTPGTASLTILPWIPPSTSEPPFPSPMAPRPAIPYSSTPALNRVNPISYKMSNRSTQLYSSPSSSNVPSSSLTPSSVSTWSNASNTPNIRSFNIYLPNQVQSRRTDSSSNSGSASNSRNILHSYSDGLAAQDDTRMKETGTGTSATSTPQTDPMNLPGDIPDSINDPMRDVGRNASGSGTGQGASRNVTREIKLLPLRNFTSEGVKKPRGLSSGRLGDEWNGQDRSVLGSGSAAASSSNSTAATTPKSKIKFAESKSSNFATPASKAIKSPISTASNSTTTTTLYGSTVTPSTTSTFRHSLETEMGATNIKKPGTWKGKQRKRGGMCFL